MPPFRAPRARRVVDRAAAAKFELLREIYDMACAQREALERDDLARFDTLLDERQVLIERLGRLSAVPVELPPNVIPFPRADANAVEDDALALETVIQGILDNDRHNEQQLLARRSELLEGFPSLQAARRSARAYRTPPTPRFIDRAS